MRYMLLAYARSAAGHGPVDRTFQDELRATDELVALEDLAHPSLARTVRPRDGGAVTVDGPATGTGEALVGCAVVDCAGLDRAMSVAARVAVATGATIEVRPIGDRGSVPVTRF